MKASSEIGTSSNCSCSEIGCCSQVPQIADADGHLWSKPGEHAFVDVARGADGLSQGMTLLDAWNRVTSQLMPIADRLRFSEQETRDIITYGAVALGMLGAKGTQIIDGTRVTEFLRGGNTPDSIVQQVRDAVGRVHQITQATPEVTPPCTWQELVGRFSFCTTTWDCFSSYWSLGWTTVGFGICKEDTVTPPRPGQGFDCDCVPIEVDWLAILLLLGAAWVMPKTPAAIQRWIQALGSSIRVVALA